MYGRGHQGGGFSIGPPVTPPIIKQLLIANLAVFIGQHLLGAAAWAFAVVPYQFWQQGYVWQPLTYMWMHSPSSLMHIGFNMLALWMFGSPLASVWGDRRFLRFYMLCGVGAGVLIATIPAIPVLFGAAPSTTYIYPTLGASGAVFGVLLAYALTWPNRTIILLFPPIPIRAIYFIPFILLWSWLFGPRNVSHVGHIGGVLVAWVILRRQEGLSILPSLGQVRYRWRRWRMRRQLRAVRVEEQKWRERSRFDDDDQRLH